MLVASLFDDIEFSFHQLHHRHWPRLVRSGMLLVGGRDSNHEDPVWFEVFRIVIERFLDLANWNVIDRLTKENHVEFLSGCVVNEIVAHKEILVAAAGFRSSPPGLGKSFFRYVDADVLLIRVRGQFVRRIPRSAAEIEKASVVRVLFEALIDAVAFGVVNELPFCTGKFPIPKISFQGGRPVALKECHNKVCTARRNLHPNISLTNLRIKMLTRNNKERDSSYALAGGIYVKSLLSQLGI
jgi:hypothetical protein